MTDIVEITLPINLENKLIHVKGINCTLTEVKTMTEAVNNIVVEVTPDKELSQQELRKLIKKDCVENGNIVIVKSPEKEIAIYVSVKRGTHPDMLELWLEKNAEVLCTEVFRCKYESSTDTIKGSLKSWFKKLIDVVDKTASPILPDIDHKVPEDRVAQPISKYDLLPNAKKLAEAEDLTLTMEEVFETLNRPDVKAVNDMHDAWQEEQEQLHYCIKCNSQLLSTGSCSNLNCEEYKPN